MNANQNGEMALYRVTEVTYGNTTTKKQEQKRQANRVEDRQVYSCILAQDKLANV